MKNILKITAIIILIALMLLVVRSYIVLADSEEKTENYIYEEVINISTEEEKSSSVGQLPGFSIISSVSRIFSVFGYLVTENALPSIKSSFGAFITFLLKPRVPYSPIFIP